MFQQNVLDKDKSSGIKSSTTVTQTTNNTGSTAQQQSGKQQSHDITGMQQAANKTPILPTQAIKQSRRTSSLLNLFMSNPHGM